MTDQKTLAPSLPSRAKMMKGELKEKIAERIKQAEELKIDEKTFLIAQQFGKSKPKDIFWRSDWHYIFKREKLRIICSTLGRQGEIMFKGKRVYLWKFPERIEVFNPSEEWLNILNKYYKKALECREKEMKRRFGLE